MPQPLAITCCRLLTPLDNPGAGARSTWEAIRAGLCVGVQAAVDDSLLDLDTSLDRSIRLALAVARAALPPELARQTALFCGTSKGPVETMLQGLYRLNENRPLTPAQARQITLGVGAMGTLVAERLGLPAGHTSVAACSSGLLALHRAAQSIWRGECERALVVAADASRHPLFEASFNRLGVLAPADVQGVRHCRPFAAEGEGFFLTEAAAAILLENPGSHGSRIPVAYLTQAWSGGDGTALIAVDSHTESLRHGLSRMRWEPSAHANSSSVEFVHAHATGTAHDRHEFDAIQSQLGAHVKIFSHKQWLGHSLGAAGLVSVAISAECHRHGILPNGEALNADASSLTIAQGFGGHIAIARLRGAGAR